MIDNSEIKMSWTKYAFVGDGIISYKWNEIEKIYQWTWDVNYYDLIIKLTSGKKLKFYHDTLTTKDDFDAFLKDLYQTFDKQKQVK